MLKTYELMTRHFGWDKLPKPASRKDITAYLLDRALRSQGVGEPGFNLPPGRAEQDGGSGA